jgi:hypothetical protein
MDGNKMHPLMTAGLDLGDKYSYLCLIDQEGGEVMEEGRDKRRTLRSSLQYPSSAPKAAGGGAGSSLKRDSGAQRERNYGGGEDYGNSGGATLKWPMATAVVARTRFGSSIR